MAEPPMSPEDEEALRLMQEEQGGYDGDLRGSGDPDWFANGAQIELFGLQSDRAKVLNGLTAEVIGFDNLNRRYRVRLHTDGTVKVAAKKNMRLLSDRQPGCTPDEAGAVGAPSPTAMQLQTLMPTASVELVPTVGTVRRAMDKVTQGTVALRQQCIMRQGGATGNNMCDAFLALTVAMDTYQEVMEMYETAYGVNEDLRAMGTTAERSADECIEAYQSLRTWAEMAIDEVNLTRYSIRKHGVVGTLKNEFVEVGRDVVEIGGGTANLVREGAGHVPTIVRHATANLGDVVQQGSQAAVATTSGVINRGHRQARQALEEQLLGPMKRTWHLIVTGFLICYLVPLFGLRTYAPLNSIVGNLGLVYVGVCMCCPPRCARSRPAKACLLILWPLCMVVLPLALHYWLTHPPDPSSRTSPARPTPQWYPPQVDQFLERMSAPAQSEDESGQRATSGSSRGERAAAGSSRGEAAGDRGRQWPWWGARAASADAAWLAGPPPCMAPGLHGRSGGGAATAVSTVAHAVAARHARAGSTPCVAAHVALLSGMFAGTVAAILRPCFRHRRAGAGLLARRMQSCLLLSR
mmetsp:Transcript_102066/g.284137  ORF Transcript_102066/g.284137 Transcript_102066/m.284137 type:complete len:579 (-) Transcript_102066:212-1948(-)